MEESYHAWGKAAPMRAQAERGFIFAAIALLLTWAFGFGWSVRTCAAADPGGILYYIVWGTQLVLSSPCR
jgi:hypothetical protein